MGNLTKLLYFVFFRSTGKAGKPDNPVAYFTVESEWFESNVLNFNIKNNLKIV